MFSVLPYCYAVLFLLLITVFPTLAANSPLVHLEHDKSIVTLDPHSLESHWKTQSSSQPLIAPTLLVNRIPQTASKLRISSKNTASWLLTPSQITLSATLDNALTLHFSLSDKVTVTRNNPIVLQWFTLPYQDSAALLLPFNEGMRIPTNNSTLMRYLVEEYSGTNTTQDLKMPFWSSEITQQKITTSPAQFVNYHLLTPTNNRLHFSIKDIPQTNHSLLMTAEHQFTPLNRHQGFSVKIQLGDTMLSAAQQYRQWRHNQGLANPLHEQQKQKPLLNRLIGASHVYLFGQDLLAAEDVKSWWELKSWYLSQSDLVPTQEAIKELAPLKNKHSWFNTYHKRVLIEGINTSLNQFIPMDSRGSIKHQFATAQKRKTWLQKHAASYLISSALWGQALSPNMIDTFNKAGLTHLWLGLDNWMPAFYQPESVEYAKKAGYLIGTYDSYNTAIAANTNDNWLTAQLPDSMREACAIENADGQKQKGFRGNGVYLHPSCQLDYVEQRINHIIKYGRFNSLFIDVDATAMAQEDYSLKRQTTESEMLAGFNHRMSTINQTQDIILGSEDGNALTTQGLAFAHGMETVGFGWTDKDMKHNRTSPYFLGAWYPDNKPAFFFKPAEVKTPYKTVYFTPEYKIPLYQAVFHDEIINSHHWHTDSIKFSNVQKERDLIMMLYNTPAMIHLNREEASNTQTRRIKALQHYQSGFAPIHNQLWDKALIGFTWLDSTGKIQQTTFSDHSNIIANFTNQPYSLSNGETLDPYSIIAYLSTGKVVVWRSTQR